MKEIITLQSEQCDVLSQRCEEVNIKSENDLVREIILALKDTIRNSQNCVGLAAPQIGYTKRIFCINFKGDIRTFINPIITNAKGLSLSREGCMSCPGKEYIRPRNNEIWVYYQTPLGKTESVKLFGFAAHVFQHELDHLDGITLADIGLEIDESYDKASEQERSELLTAYLDSLDLKQKQLQKEIEQDPELKKLDDSIKFMEAVQKGEVKVEQQSFSEEQMNAAREKASSTSQD